MQSTSKTTTSSLTSNNSILSVLNNVYTTFHGANEQGACALPNVDYNVLTPVALGDIASLGYIKFNPDLCGHILELNCGNGKMNIIITNSNLGGGLDLYASSWNKATNYLSPGIQYCTAQLTDLNPIKSSLGPICYYIQGEGFNQYYQNVAVFNTGSRITTGATLKGINGSHRGSNPYYAFDVYSNGDDQVIFSFNDGTSTSFYLRECVRGVTAKQNWN